MPFVSLQALYARLVECHLFRPRLVPPQFWSPSRLCSRLLAVLPRYPCCPICLPALLTISDLAPTPTRLLRKSCPFRISLSLLIFLVLERKGRGYDRDHNRLLHIAHNSYASRGSPERLQRASLQYPLPHSSASSTSFHNGYCMFYTWFQLRSLAVFAQFTSANNCSSRKIS